ncbi:hypothetical protein EV356DRAFT_230051 [Viridothelium virens]|uniref:Uncharacterized protein n=1 Tax=Viridothelium virens TaxID=1048519 RepID=A0A6A6H5C9_VIRVR|nr:hypothetical protein EV356DRAFT_230051 [Viridothelium virens]
MKRYQHRRTNRYRVVKFIRDVARFNASYCVSELQRFEPHASFGEHSYVLLEVIRSVISVLRTKRLTRLSSHSTIGHARNALGAHGSILVLPSQVLKSIDPTWTDTQMALAEEAPCTIRRWDLLQFP